MLLEDLRKMGTDSARSHISRLAKYDDRQCYYCMKMMGNCKPWQHVHCWDKDSKSVLKFYSHRKHGFVCPACYTSGYTPQKLCVHLMDHHSIDDLVKMGYSAIHVARWAGGTYKANTDDAFDACISHMSKCKIRMSRQPGSKG